LQQLVQVNLALLITNFKLNSISRDVASKYFISYDSITTLGLNLICGIILVTLIIWLFMGWRNALLATVGIPFSFLCTMIIMYVTDNSLNEITLFAFVLVSGIIVDDAIVVLENIYRRLQEGEVMRLAVLNGTCEIAWPVIAATSTTVAAFLPMLIMSGSTGEFFAYIPKAVSFALMASLFECLVILPGHFLDWPGARRLAACGRILCRAGAGRCRADRHRRHGAQCRGRRVSRRGRSVHARRYCQPCHGDPAGA